MIMMMGRRRRGPCVKFNRGSPPDDEYALTPEEVKLSPAPTHTHRSDNINFFRRRSTLKFHVGDNREHGRVNWAEIGWRDLNSEVSKEGCLPLCVKDRPWPRIWSMDREREDAWMLRVSHAGVDTTRTTTKGPVWKSRSFIRFVKS